MDTFVCPARMLPCPVESQFLQLDLFADFVLDPVTAEILGPQSRIVSILQLQL